MTVEADSPIVEEVRRRRMEISAQVGHDPHLYFQFLRRKQEQYRHRLANQITVVSSDTKEPPPRKS